MPKVTKKLGNNKARAWESLGFAHKKKLCQHFDTTSPSKPKPTMIVYESALGLYICKAVSVVITG